MDNCYRTCFCGNVDEKLVGKDIKVAGWIENIRDHGGVKFIDLRDHYGIVQIVVHDDKIIASVPRESVISVSGKVLKRSEDTINPKLKTGFVEVVAETLKVLSLSVNNLPFEPQKSIETREEVRLKYRFLDLRNKKIHDNIVLRSELMSFLRNKMCNLGFTEIQTPILSVSSPEGARDYLIPSRKHKGKFYALPQAPQIFKQLLMVSGFDKYYQIAPCFRDEDSRADRSPGEFYQLDFEMAFADQKDVLRVAEDVLYDVFTKFSNKEVSKRPFKRLSYKDAIDKYGTDKPDLRNPLKIIDISDIFENSSFQPFKGKTVKAINVPGCASQPKSFFENMLKFSSEIGMKGLGYIKVNNEMKFNGPIDKFIPDDKREKLKSRAKLTPGCVLYFIADDNKTAPKLAGQIRTEVAKRLNLINENIFSLCFVLDFPMYEIDEETGKIIFKHNPFSMPQGGLQSLENKDPLDILAYQYDIVCNGVELSSGAVRNHDINTIIKAFEIVGYTKDDIIKKFPSIYNAFIYGAPPHAGMAPGIERMLMLLTENDNIREVVAFPMNSNAQDLLMGSPGSVSETQLRELHIKINN